MFMESTQYCSAEHSAQFRCWHFLPHKNPKPNNLQITLVVRGLCIFLFPYYWSVARTVDLLHFTSNVQPQKELVGYALAKWKKINVTDFLWLSSSAVFQFMCFFFLLSSFSCSWCNTGNYFLYLNSRRECFFILFLYVSRDTSHFSKGWTEGWVRAPPRTESPGFRDSLPCGLYNKAEWSLTSWTDVQNQLPASHSWCCWPVQNGQIYHCF